MLWTPLGHPSSVPLIFDVLGDMLIPSLGQEMPSLKCHLCFGGWPDHLMMKAFSLNTRGSFSWHWTQAYPQRDHECLEGWDPGLCIF